MDRKSVTSILVLLLCCFIDLSTSLSQPLNIITTDHGISDKLLNKGYGAMGVFGVEQYLQHLLASSSPLSLNHNITAITIFCPTDKGFTSQNHIGIPTTLLQYHIIPFKVDREILQSSPIGSTFSTLLMNAPPLVKTIAGDQVSINNVTIMDWEIYNNGKVIVHGVDDFFNPAFPIVYPTKVGKEGCAECEKNLDYHDHDDKIEAPRSRTFWSPIQEDGSLSPIPLMALLAVVAAAVSLGFGYQRYYYSKKALDDNLPVKTNVESLKSPVRTKLSILDNQT
ncbi:hypothetical protein ACH5RR_006516 [Cinchona calisaya]|uniref:FAS1 domain-containing protein n=2 Tax=Cinchona calisaya TaxID=153742 RepID=A0ABD3AP74_9GENT